MRAFAETLRHDPMWVRAFVEPELEIRQIERDGKRTLVEGREHPEGLLIKPIGKVLTLTANEALKYGLAAAVTNDLNELQKLLGPGEWRKELEIVAKNTQPARDARRKLFLDANGLPELEAEIAAVQAKGRVQDTALNDLMNKYRAELVQADNERDRQIHNAGKDETLRALAHHQHANLLAFINSRYEPLITAQRAVVNELAENVLALLAAKKKLLDAAPK
ncbi:MAG: hypothetical protein WD042_19220 [Phycisphaeraceae bacterium]